VRFNRIKLSRFSEYLIHQADQSFDDYDVFKSPLQDFKDAAEKSGWADKIVYLGRGEEYNW
jgi:hypothetical protein